VCEQGSGQSEGSWVTLGAHEVDDLATAVDYLRREGNVSTLGLWGRSMGAVTSLIYSQRDPSIAGMVRCSGSRPVDSTGA
jgi:dienelactone hydrolase